MNLDANFWMFIMLGAFNLFGFILIWTEIRSQRKSSHHLREQFTNLYAANTVALLDHEKRIAGFEGSPFRPERIFDQGGESMKELVQTYLKTYGYPEVVK